MRGFCLEHRILHLSPQIDIILEIANDDESRQRGLMFQTSLNTKHGMLFQFKSLDYWPIWMKNMNFPIDIMWLNQDKQVIDWVDNALPCPKIQTNCPIFKPKYPAMEVIELQAGQRCQHHIHFKQTLKY